MKKRNLRKTCRSSNAIRKSLVEMLEDRRLLAGDTAAGEDDGILSVDQLSGSSRYTAFTLEAPFASNFVPKAFSGAGFSSGGLAGRQSELTALTDVDEVENDRLPATEFVPNDSLADAENIDLGFDEAEDSAINIRGEFIDPGTLLVGFSSEINPPNNPPIPDDSILEANPVNTNGALSAFTGVIGDSPAVPNEADPNLLGGDGDYYAYEELEVGDRVYAHVRTPAGADTAIVLYNQFGEVASWGDDNSRNNVVGDDFIHFTVSEAGDYYLAVIPASGGGFTFPDTPFDSTRTYGGIGGTYTLTTGINAADVDYYELDLNAGDILGLAGNGSAALLTLYGPDGQLLTRSGQNLGFVAPDSSPLPENGISALSYVVPTSGSYFVEVAGFRASRYVVESKLFRPVLESEPAGTKQVLFLDFDGASVNPEVFGAETADAELSPFDNYLSLANIPRGRKSEMIDNIVDVVKDGLQRDLAENSLNPNFGIEILNSKDHADPFGQPNVSRIIIGGTQAQLGIGTIGIAQSVDVGNFNTEETAVVLMDILPGFVRDYPILPGASIEDLLAVAVGNVVIHEAGHFFGGWHTDPFNDTFSLMDQGGNLADTILGIGEDRIWGTQDDRNVYFEPDFYVPNERFFGVQDPRNAIAFALTVGAGFDPANPESAVSGSVFADTNGNGFRDADEMGLAGVRVYVDSNSDNQIGIAEVSVMTNSRGQFNFRSINAAAGAIRVVPSPGFEVTTPQSGEFSATDTDIEFGLRPTFGPNTGIDYGDAPASYGQATHPILPGLSLGSFVDGELGPIPDDGSDDDGITIGSLQAGESASATVRVTTENQSPGVLSGWIDFNGDGTFSSNERVVRDLLVTQDQPQTFTFDVPADARVGSTFSRFRYGYERGIGPTGQAVVGEVEDYRVNIGGTGGGTPIDANNDLFTATEGDVNAEINVLGNDQVADDRGLSVISTGNPSGGGTVTIAPNQQSVFYTPAEGFVGVETFTYTISDGFEQDTAVVTVTVESVVGVDEVVRFRLETVDLEGNPIDELNQGETFVLQVFTQDLRDDGSGVFAGYLDVQYDADLVSVDGDVTFGDDFPAGQVVDVTVPGLINEAGAFAGINNMLGTDEFLLFEVPMLADAAGIVTFVTDPADVLPAHEVLLGDMTSAIPVNQIDYTTTVLIVNAPVPASAFTNATNQYDVNADGFVSPSDVLRIINELNTSGPRSLTSSISPIATAFVDVNGDNFLSPVDALMVINQLNQEAAPAGEPPAISDFELAAAVDSIFGDDRKDNDWSQRFA